MSIRWSVLYEHKGRGVSTNVIRSVRSDTYIVEKPVRLRCKRAINDMVIRTSTLVDKERPVVKTHCGCQSAGGMRRQ